jgi:excisionase family DNA binding protein
MVITMVADPKPTPPPEPRLLYSRKDAAYQLSISTRSLDYLIHEGRLHTRKIGGRILVPHEELVRFIAHDRSQVMTPARVIEQVREEVHG